MTKPSGIQDVQADALGAASALGTTQGSTPNKASPASEASCWVCGQSVSLRLNATSCLLVVLVTCHAGHGLGVQAHAQARGGVNGVSLKLVRSLPNSCVLHREMGSWPAAPVHVPCTQSVWVSVARPCTMDSAALAAACDATRAATHVASSTHSGQDQQQAARLYLLM